MGTLSDKVTMMMTWTRYKEDFFCNEGGKSLVQVAQRGGRFPIPGDIQG